MKKIEIDFSDFEKIDIRLGTIVEVKEYDKLHKPSFILKVDFGNEIGIKKSSAQIRKNYNSENLLNMQVIGVINFKPKQIGKIISEVLILGLPDEDGEPILLSPNKRLNNGAKLF